MASRYEIPAPPARRRGLFFVVILLAVVLLGARTFASYVIEYNWWREMNQVATWIDMMVYRLAPWLAAFLLAYAVLWTAHARAVKFGGARLRDYPWYFRLSSFALLLLALLLASATVETWSVVRYFGGRNLPSEATSWKDAVFGQPLSFYLFDLPFYTVLRRYLLGLAVVSAVVYWLTARGWQVRHRFAEFQQSGEFDLRILGLEGALRSWFLRGLAAVFLVALAVRFFLGRYEMLYNDHGFMVGVDYVNLNLSLPLQWVVIASCLASAAMVLAGRWKFSAVILLALLVRAAVPGIVSALYVKPNEISIERPFIQTHIQATRSAFGLSRQMKETEFPAKLEAPIDPSRHKALLDNVRLWDMRAFHDTVTQIQALRQYYTFADTDVDRYMINGQMRQVMLSPRELDINQLPDAARQWINPHFIYTHGYGAVMAEANRITPDGLPVLFIQDAPPVVKTPSLKLTRPELYYGEVTHEPVFVHTGLAEFNYPSGEVNVTSRYEGRGGFPASSLFMRLVAALSEGDLKILLTGYLKPESRMIIHRNVRERLQELAGFIHWDTDPYLVVTDAGRLVWTVDGYTTSEAHPYSRSYELADIGTVNYMRNSVKATVDAYDGTTRIYIFDEGDPIIRAYQHLFPRLLRPGAEMPADLRRHIRYSETLFRVQAEVYRVYHMRDPQAFYNKEDVWEIARSAQAAQGGRGDPASPTYVVASLPGEDQAEFLLVVPFTPRTKENMIGLMLARCDGEQYGEKVVLQLSKQELIFGPTQIKARINQDQNISKDLSLWNQQGSQVLWGQMLVLPIENTFLYVQPLYIRSEQASMPQLKKVALAMGNRLVYADTYDQALAELLSTLGSAPAPAEAAPAKAAAVQAAVPAQPDRRIEAIRNHLRRYRELAAQGRWAEAGKELESIEAEVR